MTSPTKPKIGADGFPEKEFNNDFMQQRTKHFYTRYSPPKVLLTLALVAIVFLPIGIAVILGSDSVFEVSVRYDDVNKCTYEKNDGIREFNVTVNGTATTASQGCNTRVLFNLPKRLESPIYIYYRVVGFHQNNHRYSDSINEGQLWRDESDTLSRSDIDSCSPFDGPSPGGEQLTVNGNDTIFADMMYFPCGGIAWSMFNDTFKLYSTAASTVPPADQGPNVDDQLICDGAAFNLTTGKPVAGTDSSCTKHEISFRVDRDNRFRVAERTEDNGGRFIWSAAGNTNTDNQFLKKGWYNNEPGHSLPRTTDEDLLVWSRIAGLADFRKLYRRIDVDLEKGNYWYDIDEFFDTTSIDAEKHVILATTAWIGGKNHVLGILYVVVGAIAAVEALGLIVYFIVKRSKTQ